MATHIRSLSVLLSCLLASVNGCKRSVGPPVPGLVISGSGEGPGKTTVEAWAPTGKYCSLPQLPQEFTGHTINLLPQGLVICGGSRIRNCLMLQAGQSQWVTSYEQEREREHHTSYIPQGTEAVLLLGGTWDDNLSLEMVGEGYGTDAVDTVDAVDVPSPLFGESRRRACLTSFNDSFVISGGLGAGAGPKGAVGRYNISSLGSLSRLAILPDLQVPRDDHVCGYFTRPTGDTVLVVAGGQDSLFKELRNMETLYLNSGNSVWEVVEDSLPWPLSGAMAGMVGGELYLTGGWEYRNKQVYREVLRLDRETLVWREAGQMQEGRWGHAVVAVPDINLYCQ